MHGSQRCYDELEKLTTVDDRSEMLTTNHFGDWHTVVGDRPPSRRRISELAAEFLSAEYPPKKNRISEYKLKSTLTKLTKVSQYEQLELRRLTTVLCLVY